MTGALAVRMGYSCSVNDYAVYMAVRSLQPFFNTTVDGILGPNTNIAIRNYQQKNGLWVDGVIGPKTSRSLFAPLAITAASRVDPAHAGMLLSVTLGTIGAESAWDAGCVGVTTPRDLGIMQINEVHSSNKDAVRYISTQDRFVPSKAIPWGVAFIDNNLRSLEYDMDAGIAAYNLGITGAWAWVSAGRPSVFHGSNIREYIQKIKDGSAA